MTALVWIAVGCLLAALPAAYLIRRRSAIQAEAERHAALLDQVHDAVIVWRFGGGILYWNRGAEELYGWSRQEAAGRITRDLLGTKPIGAPDMAAVEAILVEKDHWAGELHQVDRDGRELIVESRLVLVRHGHAPPAVLETNHDITARVAIERARRAGDERLRAVVETAVDAIVTIDARGAILSWNPAAERLFGYRAAEVLGQNVAMLMPEPFRGQHDGYLDRYHRTGERHIIGIGREVVARRKDGTTFPADLAVGEADVGHRIYTGILRDITDRKRAEAEREQLLDSERAARSEAERATRMKDDFLATLSHELRTPLAAIVGWVGILERSGKDAETMRAVEVIKRNAQVQTEMVEDLLDVSRIVSGKLRLEMKPTELGGVVEAATAALQLAADAKQIRLERSFDPEAALVLGDAGRLQQVVWNLVANGVKFTPRGGVVHVALRAVGACVEIVVTDSGQGVDADFLPHVFERFRQGDATTTRRHRGLGLGLALVRYIVEAHGGEVRAESEGRGRGATFTVTLPAMARSNAWAAEPAWSDPGAALRGVKVLVVDDEEDARELVTRVLEQCAVRVMAVGSAREALDQVQRARPDVMVSDIGMPEEDGYDLMRAVRALAPERGGSTPAAALTAYARPEDRERALHAGYQLHIAKPIDAQELLRAVAALARRAAAA